LRYYQKEDKQIVWQLHNLTAEQASIQRGQGKWDDDLRDISSFYQQQYGEFIVGCIDRQIVAVGGFRRVSEQKAEIRRMMVHPDFQRNGYGQKLLECLEIEAVGSGYKILTLHTTSTQVLAQRLYMRNRYVEMRRQPWHGMERIYWEKKTLSNQQ
jgi:GNAT superfamily N-acetyltransferase